MNWRRNCTVCWRANWPPAAKGIFRDSNSSARQANAVVAGIVRQGGDVPAVLGARRRELERAYGELTLMLRAQQAEVQGKLKQVRQVKRAVGVYQS